MFECAGNFAIGIHGVHSGKHVHNGGLQRALTADEPLLDNRLY